MRVHHRTPEWVNHCMLILVHRRLLICHHCLGHPLMLVHPHPLLDYLLIPVHPQPMLDCHLHQPLMPVHPRLT